MQWPEAGVWAMDERAFVNACGARDVRAKRGFIENHLKERKW
ncbi:hypothetical protein [Pseudomonas sp. NPDC089406]